MHRLPGIRFGWIGAGIAAALAGWLSVVLFAGLRVADSAVPDAFLPELVRIPPGRMSVAAPGAADGGRMEIAFERPFSIGKFEVTFAQWDFCYRAGACTYFPDDHGWGRGDRPVINVSWDDVVQYLRWLSDSTGDRYRLPTEHEWEYAARAGAYESLAQPQLFSDRRLAWASDYAIVPRTTRRTDPVGTGDANAFGVFGTGGNVWEWTDSCWQRTYAQDGARVFRENCGLRILQGEHRSFMQTFLREIGSGGCSVRPLPGNFGFRVLLES